MNEYIIHVNMILWRKTNHCVIKLHGSTIAVEAEGSAENVSNIPLGRSPVILVIASHAQSFGSTLH